MEKQTRFVALQISCQLDKWLWNFELTPKGPKAQNGFLGSLGRLSKSQKHEQVSKILEEGRTM
jgi:hypothetical protein